MSYISRSRLTVKAVTKDYDDIIEMMRSSNKVIMLVLVLVM